MAYGKIKADTFVYDNSGSDVEVTLASLGNKANLPASAGTVGASEVVQVDANKDITGFRNITLAGNLQVNGTTTTVASSTMTVTDKNIEIAKGAANDAAADGAGITVDSGDGDKTWNWVDATDSWTSSEHIHVPDDKRLKFGAGPDLEIYHNSSNGDTRIHSLSGTTNLKIGGPIIEFVNESNSETLAKFTANGACELLHNDVKKIETTATGVTVTGTVTDSKGDVRKIPQNWKTAAYTLVASDSGKHIATNSGVTIPASVFPSSGGDAITILNHGTSDITITQGSGVTMYNAADASTGNRTLAQKGVATLLFINATVCHISGAGLS